MGGQILRFSGLEFVVKGCPIFFQIWGLGLSDFFPGSCNPRGLYTRGLLSGAVSGSGFACSGFGVRVQVPRGRIFRFSGLGFGVSGIGTPGELYASGWLTGSFSGSRVSGSGFEFRVSGFGLRSSCSGCR